MRYATRRHEEPKSPSFDSSRVSLFHEKKLLIEVKSARRGDVIRSADEEEKEKI